MDINTSKIEKANDEMVINDKKIDKYENNIIRITELKNEQEKLM